MHRERRKASVEASARMNDAWAAMDDWRSQCRWCGHVFVGTLSTMDKGVCEVCGKGDALSWRIGGCDGKADDEST